MLYGTQNPLTYRADSRLYGCTHRNRAPVAPRLRLAAGGRGEAPASGIGASAKLEASGETGRYARPDGRPSADPDGRRVSLLRESII